MVERTVSLEDKFTRSEGRVFLTGLQALVRLPMAQIRRDRRQGLKTAGFISGYRGSPLGGYDQQLEKAKQHLAAHDIVFQPGVNEDLAATAVWGSQQLQLSPGARYDGVVGIWYGKGPGVDRSGDVLKHGNAAGSARHGGVLCLAGDDHGAKSSSIPHQSDHAFMSALMPMLYPSSIHEFIGMGLLGIAMSRYSGCWVGMKLISDTVETTAAIDLEDEAREFVIPADFEVPPDGLNLRWPDDRWSQDHRLQNYKGYAAIAFGRANGVDRTVFDCQSPRLGVVASGKAYEDVRQALRELEIDAATAARIGLRVYKVGMPWPIEPANLRHFCEGLEEVLIVEERREIIEYQIKQYLFNWRADVRPRIIGKFDHQDRPVLPLDRELTVGLVAEVLADRIGRLEVDPAIAARIADKLAYFRRRSAQLAGHVPPVSRLPYFCSGCPHNTSTRVPEGSRALAGIGCHFMAQWMDRRTETFTHMGAEGVPWVGIAPFTDERHIFANLGDGTYFHSGILAIRQAVASGANITYKILFNDAVAMTGGQPVDGRLTVPQISHQLKQEGVSKVFLLSEEPARYRGADIAAGTDRPAPRRDRRGDAGSARGRGVQRDHLRPDLRRREAPAPQARPDRRSGDAGVHQPPRLRGLRRLLGAEQLRLDRAARDAARAQARDQPVDLQQGLFLPQGLLPVVRHDQGRQAAPAPAGGRRSRPRRPAGAGGPGRHRAALQHRDHRRRRHRRADDRRDPRHGRPPRGQGQHDPRHGRSRAEGRCGAEPRPPRARSRRGHDAAHRHRQAPTC